MQNGQQIVYVREDSGQVLPSGLVLAPGKPVIVGTGVNGDLAEALVERGICQLVVEDATSASVSTPAAAASTAAAGVAAPTVTSPSVGVSGPSPVAVAVQKLESDVAAVVAAANPPAAQ